MVVGQYMTVMVEAMVAMPLVFRSVHACSKHRNECVPDCAKVCRCGPSSVVWIQPAVECESVDLVSGPFGDKARRRFMNR